MVNPGWSWGVGLGQRGQLCLYSLAKRGGDVKEQRQQVKGRVKESDGNMTGTDLSLHEDKY